jgi:hypothetical protein
MAMKRIILFLFVILTSSGWLFANHWMPVITPYESNMTLTGIVQINGVEQQSPTLEVGAFCGTECRGSGILAYFVPTQHYVIQMLIYGEAGDPLTFKLFDHSLNQELDFVSPEGVVFSDNGYGSLNNPFVLNFVTTHYITVSANPAVGGTVLGAGTYVQGTTATLVATPNEGYTFINWTQDGEVVSTEQTYSFIVTEVASYVANFSDNHWTLNNTLYEDNMTLTGIVKINDVEQHTTALEVGVFCGEECRGSGMSVYFAPTQHYVVQMVVYGNSGDELSFKLFDHEQNVELDVVSPEPITFTENGYGNLANPYALNFIEIHEITIAVNPIDGGTANGAGTYTHGTTATLTAMANTGYHFLNWTLGGEVVSSEASYGFTVMEDGDYVANFELNSYNISAVATPEAGGTVEGTGVYQHFSTCTLTATASTGYHFVNWARNGEEVSTETSINFMVTEAGDYVANFELNSYEITATANSETGGTVEGAGTYNHFETCTLTATADTGYHFLNWTLGGEVVSNSPTYNFEVTGAANYVANFELNSYEITVTANPEEGGTVTGTGTYNHFSTCTLTATAYEGYVFVSWNEDGARVSTEPTYSFIVTGERTIEACFDIPSVGEYVDLGLPSGLLWATCNVGANTPEEYGDYFAWGETQSKNSYSWSTYQYCMGDANTLTKYCDNPDYGYNGFTDNLTVLLPEDDAATVNWGAEWRTATQEEWQELLDNTIQEWTKQNGVNGCLFTAANGASLFLPIAGYRWGDEFFGAGGSGYYWSSSLYTGSPRNAWYFSFHWGRSYVDDDYYRSDGRSVRAVRSAPQNLIVTAMSSPAEGGTVTGAGTYIYGETCTLIATANTGYTFISWTMGDEVVSTEVVYSFSVIEAGDYVANFELNSYEITATSNSEEGGTVTGAGTYYHFDTCTLTATANEGYHFLSWTSNGTVVSTEATYSFEVTGLASYVANFELYSYDITATANPTEGGTVTGAGTYDHFSTCTLTASANTGYHFLNWTLDGEVVSIETAYNFVVTGAAACVANFELNSYAVTVTASPEAGGTITGAGTYDHFSTCTLTATANEGYAFINWTKDGNEVSTSETYNFTVTETAAFMANFELTNITQPSSLAQGWNWWSCYVEADNLLEQLESGLGSSGQTIKSQNGYVQYMPGYDIWYGSTGFSVTNEAFYMVQTNGACEVSIVGAQADPANHPITLATGWNWIGYPSTSHMNFTTAFSGITPSDNDQVKSQSHGFASYMAAYGIWYGTLADYGIDPGMGLMYKSNNGSSFSFTYPNGRNEGETMGYTEENNHWTADYNAYPNNMTVTAVVELDDVELNGDNYELAAFANGECRGSVRLMYVAPLNRYMAFLTVAGDESAELTFGLYNTENGAVETVCTPSLQYETNAVVGSLETPYVIRFRSTTGVDDWANSLHVFPNPVNHGERFSIDLPEGSKVRVEIVNAIGTVLSTETSIKGPASILAPNTAGIYTLRITVEGKGTCYRKLVVR